MMQTVFWAVLLLAGGVAANTISEQDQIYIVSGVLGGVCLLLCIVVIIGAIAIIKLQTQVAVLQRGESADNRMVVEPPSKQQQQQQQQQAGPSRGEELNRYSSQPQEDPYRAPSNKDNYRMERPVPPPRPYRAGPPPRDNYY